MVTSCLGELLPGATPSPAPHGAGRGSADWIRSRIERQEHDRDAFRAALLGVAPADRDAWLDRVLGIPELPDDGSDLPRGCVPYVPCPVDALLRVVEQAHVSSTDVFVDVGSGLGRAAALVCLLTGAEVMGVEVQSRLVCAARELAARLRLPAVSFVEGDAIARTELISVGTVFFFYSPFSGERLAKVLGDLEVVSRARTIRVCSLDLPLPACPWLTLEPQLAADVAIYRSNAVPP